MCATTEEWIKKMWHIDYYSTIKKDELMSFAGKWMELQSS
jgi:hypothetical protein